MKISNLSLSKFLIILINIIIIPCYHLEFLYQQWMSHLISLFHNQTKSDCAISPTQMELIIKLSGKALFNLGDESQCVAMNMSYNLLMIQRKEQLPEHSRLNRQSFFFEDINKDLHKFLYQSYFFYGYCIPKECQPSFNQIFNKNNKDPSIRNNLLSLLFYDNDNPLETFDTSVHVNSSDIKSGFIFDYTDVYFWLITIIISISVIRIIISIVCFFIIRKRKLNNEAKELLLSNYKRLNTMLPLDIDDAKDKNKDNNELNSHILEPDDRDIIAGEFSPTTIRSSLKLSNGISSGGGKLSSNDNCTIDSNDYKEIDDNIDFPCCNILNQISSISKCFNLLIGKRNFYYNSKGIELISFFQMYLLFWQTLNHILYTMILIPSKSIIETIAFFKSSSLIIVKYSVFASDLWVALDGMIMGYKLMSFIKTYIVRNKINNQSSSSSSSSSNNNCSSNTLRIPLKTFLLFYFNFIPKMFIYFLVFILFYYYSDNLSLFMDLPSLFHIFSKNLIQCRDCLIDPSIIMNPFKIYFIGGNNKRTNTYCFKFIIVFLNEFTCFTFVCILIYIALLIQKAWFDYTILLILIINILLKFLIYLPACGYKLNYITLDYIFGTDCSLRFPHLMLNVYLMGFFIGITWFYYKDTIETYSFDSLNLGFYRPFKFCYTLSKCINNLSSLIKTIIIIITIIAQIFLCCTFYLFYNNNPTRNNNVLLKIIDCYEKDIFRFFFLMTVLIIAFCPDETFLKHMINEYNFRVIGRIGFCYFCVMDIFIYFFFTIGGSDFHLNFFNGVCLAIGNIFLLVLFCVVFVIGFEMPIKMMLKILIKTKGGMITVGIRRESVVDKESVGLIVN